MLSQDLIRHAARPEKWSTSGQRQERQMVDSNSDRVCEFVDEICGRVFGEDCSSVPG